MLVKTSSKFLVNKESLFILCTPGRRPCVFCWHLCSLYAMATFIVNAAVVLG